MEVKIDENERISPDLGDLGDPLGEKPEKASDSA
jgi:hypothetical protein